MKKINIKNHHRHLLYDHNNKGLFGTKELKTEEWNKTQQVERIAVAKQRNEKIYRK
jgi:hypothetical protein